MNSEETKQMATMVQFVTDHQKNSRLEITEEHSALIEQLFLRYRKHSVAVGDVLITLDTGMEFGNVEIRYVIELLKEAPPLKYESGSYDYVSVVADKKGILWTDFDNTEPFDRQGGFYFPYRFSDLKLNKTTKAYREFLFDREGSNRTSFGIWGYCYNDYWKTVRFGICVKKEYADTFVSELRKLLNK